MCIRDRLESGYEVQELAELISRHDISLVIIGPEDPLDKGVVDDLSQIADLAHVRFFGPGKAGARLESSKAFAKEFMAKEHIPTAAYREFSKAESADCLHYLQLISYPAVIKADGLAAGKGVIIAPGVADAVIHVNEIFDGKFGHAGDRILIEEFLSGREFSVFIAIHGGNYVELPVAKDYKKVFEGDQGPNTGGMGAVSPVPFVTEQLMDKVRSRIIAPTVARLQKDDLPYTGFIFFGLIEVNGDPFVIEYNARFGDPEAEVIFPRIKGDLVATILQLMTGNTVEAPEIDERFATGIYITAKGYPEKYPKGTLINTAKVPAENYIYQGGTTIDADGHLLSNGGRVLFIGALDTDLSVARQQALAGADALEYADKFFRRDIAYDAG